MIAEFALEHPTDMALGTVAEVAQRAKVQPSAIVRFARAMGYGGFTECSRCSARGSSPALRRPTGSALPACGATAAFATQAIRARCWRGLLPKAWSRWKACRMRVREKDLARAVELLGAAHTIYVWARRFVYRRGAPYLRAAQDRAARVLLDGLGNALGEQAAAATKKTRSSPSASNPTIPKPARLFPELTTRGVPGVRSPTACSARSSITPSVVFEIPDMPEAALRTMVAPMCLVQSLAVGLTLALD